MCKALHYDTKAMRTLGQLMGRSERRQFLRHEEYNAEWRRFSKWFMAAHPLCNRCQRRNAEIVHHIVPLADGGEHCREENSEALCRKCHIEEHHGTGRAKTEEPRG